MSITTHVSIQLRCSGLEDIDIGVLAVTLAMSCYQTISSAAKKPSAGIIWTENLARHVFSTPNIFTSSSYTAKTRKDISEAEKKLQIPFEPMKISSPFFDANIFDGEYMMSRNQILQLAHQHFSHVGGANVLYDYDNANGYYSALDEFSNERMIDMHFGYLSHGLKKQTAKENPSASRNMTLEEFSNQSIPIETILSWMGDQHQALPPFELLCKRIIYDFLRSITTNYHYDKQEEGPFCHIERLL